MKKLLTTSVLRRIVLDVLKPLREPSLVEIAQNLSQAPGVEGVNVTVNELDVETVKLTIIIEGNGIDFEDVKKRLEEAGAVIHSIDQVVAGRRTVEVPEVLEE